MSASQKLRWKKLVNQLRYLYEELDIVDTMATDAARNFQEYYEKFCQNHDVDIVELNRQHAERIQEIYGRDNEPFPLSVPYSGSTNIVAYKERPAQEACVATEEVTTEDEKQMYDIFSKLFKKLALHIHPDKLNHSSLTQEEKDDMLNMFTKARAALEEHRYFVLLNYAEKLNIPLPKNYKQQQRWMKKEVVMVRDKIADQMKSYNYMFADSDTDQQRDKLIRQFIQQLFNVTIPQEKL